MWNWGYPGGWGWMSGVGMLMMVLVWGGLIALVVWGITRLTRGSGSDAASRPTTETPRQQLDRRLAAGEINAQEYAQTRRLLESRSVDPGAETPPETTASGTS
ncbi:MAG: SHOCT domain-containing protein [Actinomycetes bacterium]